jgi:hypothetical protein
MRTFLLLSHSISKCCFSHKDFGLVIKHIKPFQGLELHGTKVSSSILEGENATTLNIPTSVDWKVMRKYLMWVVPNMISTRNIPTCQQNGSTIMQSYYSHGVHNPQTWILSNTYKTKWIVASDSVKTFPPIKMTFGRSCKRNGTTLRWEPYKIWWK